MTMNRVVAIGDFDGVHRGHRELLVRLLAWAKELDAEPMAITFNVNTKGRAVLTDPAMKEYYIRQIGGIPLLVLPFDRWKEVSAEEFTDQLLKKELRVVGVLSGGDLHFGKDRTGNEFTLISRGIAVKKVEDQLQDQLRISSSHIRDLIQNGKIAKAEEAMGHPFSLMGTVCHGKGLARQFGLPTVNILPAEQQLLPPFGVYAAWVEAEGVRYRAVANIGLRPTVENTDRPNLEAHLLEESAPDLYGKTLLVELKAFLRPEQKFEDTEQLFLQIKEDGEKSKEVLV